MRKTLLTAIALASLSTAASVSAQTFTTASPPAAIPDNSAGAITACQTVVVPAGTGNITDLNVSVSATHTWVGDVTYRLQSPGNASTLMLMNRPGRNGSLAGSSTNLAAATPLVFDDAAASGRSAETAGQNPVGTNCTSAMTVGADCPPNNFTPAPDATDTPIAGLGTNLAQFNGTLADGTWTLCAADSASLDTGTLQSFSLIITASGGATPPQFAYNPAAGQTVTATGGGTIGSTGTLTITPSVGTAGVGTGAGATTTLTCTPPTTPFSGFGQTVTAIGTGAISGGPLSGTCTLGASAVTQTLTCNENRGGTANTRTWTLSCPAGTVPPPAVVQSVDALGNLAKLLMLLAVLGVGLIAVRRH